MTKVHWVMYLTDQVWQGLFYNHLRDWFIHSLSHWVINSSQSSRRHKSQTVRAFLGVCSLSTMSEMSSDSRESLDHRDPPLFFESWYQSRYQDCDLKSLDSSLDIKTQDLIVSIPVSISRLKFHKSQFQSRYQDSTIKSLNSSLNIQT